MGGSFQHFNEYIVKDFIADVWENPNCMVKVCVLTPSLTPRDEILVSMVSCGMVGMASVVS